jgi:hypothetical protein
VKVSNISGVISISDQIMLPVGDHDIDKLMVDWGHNPARRVSRARVYPVNTLVPGWQASRDTSGDTAVSVPEFSIQLITNLGAGSESGPRKVFLYYIDFESCYPVLPTPPTPGCTSDVWDDFDRTITASTSDSVGFGTGGLGTWVREPLSTNILALVGVNGSSGTVAYGGGPSPAPGRYVYHHLADQSWHTPIEIIIDSHRDSFSNNSISFMIATGDSNNLLNNISFDATGGAGGVAIESMDWNINGDGNGANIFPFPARGLTTGQLQRSRWLIEDTQMRCKFWALTDTEPATWDGVLSYPAGTLDPLLANAHVLMQVWSHITGGTYVDKVEIKQC